LVQPTGWIDLRHRDDVGEGGTTLTVRELGQDTIGLIDQQQPDTVSHGDYPGKGWAGGKHHCGDK
jgi:hypothetical protein